MEVEKKDNATPTDSFGNVVHSYEDFKALFFPYIQDVKSRQLIHDAYTLAKEKHEGQFRKSGEAYIVHPLEVAYICAELQSGPATLASALLHDVVEDTDVTIEEIGQKFGEEVQGIVDSLTKIQRMKLSHKTEEDFEAEDHRKIFLGMAKDVRVIIVKLADRLHNMRTLASLSPERQKALSKETLEVFTPIAHRLGLYNIQSELEDISLKYLEPSKYNRIEKLVEQKCVNTEKSLEQFKKKVADTLYEQKIPFRLESRVKSVYSIYKKMYRKDYEFEQIYDVLAIRIITETVINCYEILGIIHSMFAPIQDRFKDYIATPKPNMYQSIHTSVLAGDSQTYEVQIRTEEMDRIAETGVAAHWKYKENSNYSAKAEQKEIENQLHWFRDFVAMSGESDVGAKEYMQGLTHDIFGANVYVFTPLGKVIDLPTGSTTLDFAYKIHTRVGDSATGAIVNGIGVPLNTVLKTGDVCEIRTSKNASPNSSWLEIAKTSSARSHIKKALQRKEEESLTEERTQSGKASLMDSFRNADILEEEAVRILENNITNLKSEFHCNSIDDLYLLVYGKNPTPSAVLDFLKIKRKSAFDLEKAVKRTKSAISDTKYPVRIPGMDSGMAVTLGKCCCPIPGDSIVGYVTRGKGITVHRVTCPNIIAENRRLIDAYWKEDLGLSNYPVDIEIYSSDRPNLLAEILQTLSAKGVGVSDLSAHSYHETQECSVTLTALVTDAKILQDCFADLLGLKGVYSVTRVTH
ncbi:MAG: bifunctional (p)ppGpp synthetase/guanosine-3',5'-bis(diphosphate) 3'-pyrophosphohydrolase [Bacilli bacterium]|nr:bifunctional (p)ppGpp synthetase/guanosine-3',5'-bis(diphosphate) 3'-pyrophosphohydrolase [Bacilli bacterium]